MSVNAAIVAFTLVDQRGVTHKGSATVYTSEHIENLRIHPPLKTDEDAPKFEVRGNVITIVAPEGSRAWMGV